MKTRLFNLAAGVSLLLAVAIIILWVRTYWQHDHISCHWRTLTERRSAFVDSSYSSISFEFTSLAGGGQGIDLGYQYSDFTWRDSAYPRPRYCFPVPPLRFQHDSSGGWDIRDLTLAYWLLLPPTLILPTIAIARHCRRRRRASSNLCPACGYDLRAHNAGDRCPECGMANLRAV